MKQASKMIKIFTSAGMTPKKEDLPNYKEILHRERERKSNHYCVVLYRKV
jgi:hypothetical protein